MPRTLCNACDANNCLLLTEYLGDAAQVVAITFEGYVLILEVSNKSTSVLVVASCTFILLMSSRFSTVR
jgi:hypothetical protein